VSDPAPVLASFEAALARLQDALAQPCNEWTRDAALQRFEFTFELAWKAARRAALKEGLEAASPRESLKNAWKLGWIQDDPLWLRMLEDRNRTSQTYSEATASEIYARLPGYAEALAGLARNLRSRPE
jgi:nucleotidyltransferase substrate binding protein (TIGR01987 family)